MYIIIIICVCVEEKLYQFPTGQLNSGITGYFHYLSTFPRNIKLIYREQMFLS